MVSNNVSTEPFKKRKDVVILLSRLMRGVDAKQNFTGQMTILLRRIEG